MKTFPIMIALMLCATQFLLSHSAQAEESKSRAFRSDSLFDFTDEKRWIFRARALMVDPDESANIDTIGGSVDIDEQYVPEIDFTYFFTKNVAAELILATTPHDVTAINTASGQIDLGDVWLLPPTLTLQYHFFPDNTFRPYVGAGINYTFFYNGDPDGVNDIDYDDSIGYALQAGFDYGLNENWAINFDVKKVMINSDVTINSGGTIINADVDIDPWIFGLGVAYRF
ncbi:MAG: OmpW family protein [Pseudomonadota bacterium]